MVPRARAGWLLTAMVAVMSGVGTAAEEASPGYRDFWTDSVYIHDQVWPSSRRREVREEVRDWQLQRQAAFFRPANIEPIDTLMGDEDCQAVMRLLYDPNIYSYSVVATLRFTSDGLHVRSARFDRAMRRRMAVEISNDWEEHIIVEEKRFPRETRNCLALALNRIRVGVLESVEPDIGRERPAIPIIWPPPHEARLGGFELSTEWRVDVKAKGEHAFSNSFTFQSADMLADVRYRNLLACVGRVCEPVARMPMPSPGSFLVEEEVEQAGTEDETAIAGVAERVTVDSSQAAPSADLPGKVPEAHTTGGLRWPHFALGVVAGAVLGTAGAWLLLRRRAA